MVILLTVNPEPSGTIEIRQQPLAFGPSDDLLAAKAKPHAT